MTSYDEMKGRYVDALHAMQTGVKMLFARQAPSYGASNGVIPETAECSPTHLRVGVNSALLDSSAVAALLIDKGIITPEEHIAKLAEFVEADVATYREKLGLPPNVHLG